MQSFLSPEFGTELQREVPLFLYIPEFPYNTVCDRSKEAHMPQTSSICPSISIEHRLVTDRQTQTQGHSWYLRYHSVARVKKHRTQDTQVRGQLH